MNDMSSVIIPKSDQINADDLIAGPLTITITEVEIRPGTEQPVTIRYVGDNGKPWRPCKSMSRVLVAAWGPDASKYAGRAVKLYRDPSVKWAGMEVGGIRISEMSDIDKPMVLALTETKKTRKPYTVKPLVREQPPTEKPKPTRGEWLDALERRLMAAPDLEAVHAISRAPGTMKAFEVFEGADKARLDVIIHAATVRASTTPTTPSDDDDFPGDRT